jgi:hypothetical protein
MNFEGRTGTTVQGSLISIDSIPWQFHASKYGLLEQLFVPLLSSAQQASDLLAARINGDTAALQAAAYMAGELLRDVSFLPVRRGMSSDTWYNLDFAADRFLAGARIAKVVDDSTSLFRVLVGGTIRGDTFQVSDPTTKARLFEFTRFEADKPDFFTQEFPFLAHEARKNPALVTGGQDALGLHAPFAKQSLGK